MGRSIMGANAQRCLRRSARLMFPKHTLRPEVLDQIVAEGFDDVCVTLLEMEEVFGDQSYSLAQARELAELAEPRGLSVTAFVSYMKYQEPLIRREPERAMVVCDPVDPVDRPSRMICPFQPENKRRYVDLLNEVGRLPALREIHLNDEASLNVGNAIGCYCDYCCQQFETLNGSPPPRGADWESPSWLSWLEHRMRSWIKVHGEFRQQIKRHRPEVAVGIKHSPTVAALTRNPWKDAVCLGREAQAFDTLALNPYHFTHVHIADYRPYRRLLSESTRSLAGACLDCAVNVYPQGFMPPGVSTPLDRQDGLMAGIVPFALGADTTMPFDYMLMKIVPGYFEGFCETRRLQDEMQIRHPYAFATLLNPLQSEIYGHGKTDWGRSYLARVGELMYRSGLPWRWFWDQQIEYGSDQLHGPLIVPDAHCLTEPQIAAIRQVAQHGEGVLWIGNTPAGPWEGHGPAPLPSPFEQGCFELDLVGDHPVLEAISLPVMLETRMKGRGPTGQVIGTVDGQPGLVLLDNGDRREAWLRGLPMHSYVRSEDHGAVRTPTAGVILMRQLLCWLAQSEPLVRLDPYPPVNDYGRLRPWDVRDVPTVELLPLVSGRSILAIVFPYVPLRCETSLMVRLPQGAAVERVVELWCDEVIAPEETGRPEEIRIPIHVSGNCELMAFRIELSGAFKPL